MERPLRAQRFSLNMQPWSCQTSTWAIYLFIFAVAAQQITDITQVPAYSALPSCPAKVVSAVIDGSNSPICGAGAPPKCFCDDEANSSEWQAQISTNVLNNCLPYSSARVEAPQAASVFASFCSLVMTVQPTTSTAVQSTTPASVVPVSVPVASSIPSSTLTSQSLVPNPSSSATSVPVQTTTSNAQTFITSSSSQSSVSSTIATSPVSPSSTSSSATSTSSSSPTPAPSQSGPSTFITVYLPIIVSLVGTFATILVAFLLWRFRREELKQWFKDHPNCCGCCCCF